MKLKVVTHAKVPKYMDITLSKIYKSALEKFPDLIDYFPHYEDDYIPPRDFFWNVLNAVKPGFVRLILKQQQDKRFGIGEGADEGKLIEIRADLYDEIMNASHIHCKL